MTTPITQKNLLRIILRECQDWHNGRPIAILKAYDDPYYRMDPHKDPRGYTSSFFKSNHAITMIEQIWQAKPLSTDYLGMKDIRFHESDKSYPPISVYNTLAAVHDSHFRGNRIDVDTVGVDMLLNAKARDIDFRYFLLRKTSLEHAPHLFVNNCLVPMPATVFETPNKLVPRLLQDIEVKHGSIGYMVAFQGLRPTTRGCFSETYVDKYTGYNGVDAYHNVSEERWVGGRTWWTPSRDRPGGGTIDYLVG